MPVNASVTSPRSVRSTRLNVAFWPAGGRAVSTLTTSYPCVARSSTTARPSLPDPPVTTTRLIPRRYPAARRGAGSVRVEPHVRRRDQRLQGGPQGVRQRFRREVERAGDAPG